MNSPQNQNTATERQPGPVNFTARASVVNRTHRVVRERALVMQEQRRRSRDLWLPLGICSVLLLGIFYAAWSALEGYDELAPRGIPDSSDQLFLFLLWSLPLTVILLGLVWFKRERSRANNEVIQ